MQAITNLNRWANAHTNVFTDGLRILFGGFIFFKGIYFLDNLGYLDQILRIAGGKGNYFFMVRFITLAHLCGGIFIILGLATRLAALVQIPILVGAVTVNFIGAMDHSNFLQSLLAFFVCAFFIVYGSGKHSIDKLLRLHI